MAARRVFKTSVDWMAFSERVPPNQKELFRAFKAKSDGFLASVVKYPENMPKIDWAYYRSRISAPGLVDQYEKAYQNVNIAYPKDKDNVIGQIENQQKEAAVQSEKTVQEARQIIEEARTYMSKLDTLPDVREMTHEMYADYFPDQARNPSKPTFWPHNKSSQPGQDPHEIK